MKKPIIRAGRSLKGKARKAPVTTRPILGQGDSQIRKRCEAAELLSEAL